MKNEKFCFNKGTGLIALLGIVLVAAVFFMNYTTSQQQPMSTKASFGCPGTLSYPVASADPNFSKMCMYPMTNEKGELYKITVDGNKLLGTTTHESTCCYVPGTFQGGSCPANSAPRPFCLNIGGVDDSTGVFVTNTSEKKTWPCCKTHIYNNANNLPTNVPTAVPPIVLTPDPRTVTQTCVPDATKFLPSNLGCSVCSSASNTKLTDFKNKLAGYFGGAANVPNYFAGGSSTAGGRVCYSMYTLPAKTGAKTTGSGSSLLCTDPSCVMCVNQVVDNKYCLGTKADCSPNNTTNKANLLAIVSDFNAKKYTDARTKLTNAFGLSNTQVTQDVVNQGLSNCYMYNAAVYGATPETASFAFQPRGFCGHLQLATKYQGICTCAKMQNLDNDVCKEAMNQIKTLAQ